MATQDEGIESDEAASAVLYLRVSTKEQAERGDTAEGFSIPAQRTAAIRKAESLGATVTAEFVDRGESARSANRPELQKLLRFIAEHPTAYVIVHKVDRLARNRADDVEINLALQAAGTTLVSVTENIDETPSGALLHGIMSSIAEFYSRNLASEVIKGSEQKARAGGTIGKAPTGYLNVRKVVDGREIRTVDVDPERGPLMRWALEQYATGEWTTRTLLAEVTERGLVSTPGPKTPSKPLALSHFCRLLKNPYYKGLVRYRRAEYPGNHEPLISEATWDEIQRQLEAKGRSGEKQRVHHHYLKGSIVCGSCGSRMVVNMAKGRLGTVYPYFVCLGRQQKRTRCTQRAVLIEQVEVAVESYYRRVQPTTELLERLRDFIIEELDRFRVEADDLRNQIEERVESLKRKQRKLLEAHYADAIPLDLFTREQKEVTGDLARSDARLASLDSDHQTITENLSRAFDLAGNWHQAYTDADDKIRRALNQAIFTMIEVFEDGSVAADFTEPFGILLGQPRSDEEQEPTGQANESPPTSWFEALLTSETNNPRSTNAVGGCEYELLVGDEGLEPPTLSV